VKTEVKLYVGLGLAVGLSLLSANGVIKVPSEVVGLITSVFIGGTALVGAAKVNGAASVIASQNKASTDYLSPQSVGSGDQIDILRRM
jgi:hypothetical protein